jgi:gluconolactonase
MKYPVEPDGTLGKGAVFLDVTAAVKQGLPGLPDGMKVDASGNLFAAGPGGIYVITPGGKVLGRIETGQRTANCAWGDDGATLYMAADHYLCRLRTKTRAAVMPGTK